jgi:hypothetical protein
MGTHAVPAPVGSSHKSKNHLISSDASVHRRTMGQEGSQRVLFTCKRCLKRDLFALGTEVRAKQINLQALMKKKISST